MSEVKEAFGNPTETALLTQIGTFSAKLDDIATEMGKAKLEDTARFDALNAERASISSTLTELKAKHDADVRETDLKAAVETAAEWRTALANTRTASKALTLGSKSAPPKGHQGDFLMGVFMANHRDANVQAEGKAKLAELGYDREEAWGKAALSGYWDAGQGKATLGTTDATGGWVIPNAIVDEYIAPGRIDNIYRTLMTSVTGVTAPAVDIPFRSAARTRAAIVAFGDTKENVGLAYNGYTATMYTLARIYDVSNQFLRQSRGAAEQDVMSELSAAFAQGESYYIREGSGSSQPFGYTSALNNAQPAFRSAFTPSATTLAGSIATAIATAAGALAGRGAVPIGGQGLAAVLSATSYWTMLAQGTDTAGFFFAPAVGPQGLNPGTLVTPFGIPVYPDADADLEGTAAVVDNLIVANWKKFKVYYGAEYRVDSSDVAGSRWDTNLTGFRGEEEMGFDARPAVYAGYAQMIQDIVP